MTQASPEFPSATELEQRFTTIGGSRPIVCIQGLGFVGAAMAAAVAAARDAEYRPVFNVIGVDLPSAGGRARAASINNGKFPFATTDGALARAVSTAVAAENLVATDDERAFGLASVILIDVNFDLDRSGEQARFALEPFRTAVGSVGRHMHQDALVIVETTVPPGTCAKVVAPELARHMRERGLPDDQFLLAHAYERVMPGDRYLDSIVNFWRVFAGHTPAAATACEQFLSAIVNTRDFPLRRLANTTASETAKVLENSYRAVTIAMMEEWGRFAEAAGVDLFEIVSAIRVRPTHSNMRTPGLGVGGYCLTKDPLFASVAARDLFSASNVDFPFSASAVQVNEAMPMRALARLESAAGGALAERRILLLGLAYRPDVGDTRSSPSLDFRCAAERKGAHLAVHDPLVVPEAGSPDGDTRILPAAESFDIIVFAVDHEFYRALDFEAWLGGRTPLIFDANGILTPDRRAAFRELGCKVVSVGRGDEA